MMLKAAVTCLVLQGSLCSLSPCKLRAQLRLPLCPLLFLLLRAATAKAEGTTNAVCFKTSVIAWQRLLPLAQGAWVQHGLVERRSSHWARRTWVVGPLLCTRPSSRYTACSENRSAGHRRRPVSQLCLEVGGSVDELCLEQVRLGVDEMGSPTEAPVSFYRAQGSQNCPTAEMVTTEAECR